MDTIFRAVLSLGEVARRLRRACLRELISPLGGLWLSMRVLVSPSRQRSIERQVSLDGSKGTVGLVLL